MRRKLGQRGNAPSPSTRRAPYRSAARAALGGGGVDDGLELPPGQRNDTKDELREILLRRLRGDDSGDPRRNESRAATTAQTADTDTADDDDNARVETATAQVANKTADGWIEKLKSVQIEKSQLEKALLERDAEIAALRQKENALTDGCEK